MPASNAATAVPASNDAGTPVAKSPAVIQKAASAARAARRFEQAYGVLNVAGLGFLVPITRMLRGESPRSQLKDLWRLAGVPIVAMLVFLFMWSQMSSRIVTSLGTIPGPVAVWNQVGVLWADHKAEREKRVAFYERQDKRNADRLAEDPTAEPSKMKYTGKPTYIDQIFTSLRTVFTGFVIASVFAIPLGIICGLSPNMNAAINPFVQIFKPVSPLAWLPLVTMVVSAMYVTDNPMFESRSLLLQSPLRCVRYGQR